MRAVCQRVSSARVTVAGTAVGEIDRGLVVLLGVARGDVAGQADRLAGKVARLRVFEGEQGNLTHSLLDTGGAAPAVSQFTLIAVASARRERGRTSRRQLPRKKRSRSTKRSARRS